MSRSRRYGVWVVLALGLVACSEGGGDKARDADAGGQGRADAGEQPGADAGESGADGGGGEEDGGNAPQADAGTDAGAEADVTACLEAAQGKDSDTEALEFVADDGTQIAIVRYRDPDGFGTSGTTIWLPERFGYARAAASACITDADKLTYTISHHNFDDVMGAEAPGLALTFHQTRVDYDMPMFFSVEAKNGNTNLWGPLDLTLVSCQNLTTSEDCKGRY